VAEQGVVVLAQEPHRGGDLRLRARCLGKVEQLTPALVAEAQQERSQRLEHAFSRVNPDQF